MKINKIKGFFAENPTIFVDNSSHTYTGSIESQPMMGYIENKGGKQLSQVTIFFIYYQFAQNNES